MIAAKIQPVFQKGFAKTCRWLLKRHFSEVLIDEESEFGGLKPWPRQAGITGPLFFVVSHSSWWDGILAGELCLNQQHLQAIGPMDQEQLERRLILRRVGIFGTKRGDGLAAGNYVWEHCQRFANAAVWVHPQAVFTPNEKPQPKFFPGVSEWSRKVSAVRIPVALHYAFGPEKKPRAFVRLGRPIAAGSSRRIDLEKLRSELEKEIVNLLDRIATAQAGPAADYRHFSRLVP